MPTGRAGASALRLCAACAVIGGGLCLSGAGQGFGARKGQAGKLLSDTAARSAEMDGLLRWARDEDVAMKRLEPSAFGDMGIGLRATGELSSGEVALQVPARAALSVTTGSGSSDQCPIRDFVDQQWWERASWDQRLAALLLRERSMGGGSRLDPWLRSLPTDLSFLPLSWTDAELALLRCGATRASIDRQRESWLGCWPEFRDALVDRATLSERKASRFAGPAPSESDFLWALGIVRSRAFSGAWEGSTAAERALQAVFLSTLSLAYIAIFGVDKATDALQGFTAAAVFLLARDVFRSQKSQRAEEAGGAELDAQKNTALLTEDQRSKLPARRYAVCPVVDLLNHDGGARGVADVRYEYFLDAYSVCVCGADGAPAVGPGEQAFISYGGGGSGALLQNYGFVATGAGRQERVPFEEETALDWLAANGKLLTGALEGWEDGSAELVAGRIQAVEALGMLGGRVWLQGRVDASAERTRAAIAFDAKSERALLALVASSREIEAAGPKLEIIQNRGLSWDALSDATRQRYAALVDAARAELLRRRGGADARDEIEAQLGAESDARQVQILQFRKAQLELLA